MSSLGTSSTVPSYNPYPDEKGTESPRHLLLPLPLLVTIPTPMKRGLKVVPLWFLKKEQTSYNPYPDEKGTESPLCPVTKILNSTLQSLPR